jgi:hypothetical protein
MKNPNKKKWWRVGVHEAANAAMQKRKKRYGGISKEIMASVCIIDGCREAAKYDKPLTNSQRKIAEEFDLL